MKETSAGTAMIASHKPMSRPSSRWWKSAVAVVINRLGLQGHSSTPSSTFRWLVGVNFVPRTNDNVTPTFNSQFAAAAHQYDASMLTSLNQTSQQTFVRLRCSDFTASHKPAQGHGHVQPTVAAAASQGSSSADGDYQLIQHEVLCSLSNQYEFLEFLGRGTLLLKVHKYLSVTNQIQ